MANQVSPDVSVSDILRSLESKTTVNTERSEAYAKFTRHFRENDVTLFGLDVAKEISRILAITKADASSSDAGVASGALQVLGACLNDSDIVNAMSLAESKDVISMLCSIVLKTEDKSVCSCALWCIKSQNLLDAIIAEQTEDIIGVVEHAVEKWLGSSVSVIHECVNTIDRLYSQTRKEMNKMTNRWGKLLIPLVVHGAVRVRERVLAVIELTLSSLKEANKTLATALKTQVKQKLMPGLKTLFKENQECYVLKCWSVLVNLYGEELHHSSQLNEFLVVVELGFKSTEPQVKIAAFQAWQQLIDNFALNQAVLQDPKRIKLIMQVFKHNNARNEGVAMEKLSCWWHFIWMLGNKVSPNFDMVAAPLLQFCIGGKASDHGGASTPKIVKPGTSPVTPHLKLSSVGNQQFPVYKELQLRGCEVLAYFLGNMENESVDYTFHMDALRYEVIAGPSFFIKQSSLFVTSTTELICTLGKDISENLVLFIWKKLVSHMKNAIDSPAKLDIRESLNTLLQQFQVIVLSKCLTDSVILKMLMELCSLPKKVLCSSAYSVGASEMVNGTPSLYLTGLLLTPNLLQSSGEKDIFHTIFQTLLNNSVGHSTCTLEFLQSVMDIVGDNAQFVKNAEILGGLWSAVVTPFLEYVNKSNEVNQGDSLEHNFQCSVQILTFPVIHKLYRVQQQTEKTLVKTWTELYRTVNRLAAMVTNADGNVICEEVCSKLLAEIKDDNLMETEMVSLLSHMSHVITSCLDFSSIGNQSAFNLGTSPKKWSKKKQRPLENIHSLVCLLARLLEDIVKIVDASENNKKKLTSVSLQAVLNSLTDTLCILFTHAMSSDVISNLIIHLANPIAHLLSEAGKKSVVKVYSTAFLQKLEKLWSDICTCLMSRYTAMFDSELLHKYSPLLEATFLHSRRQIKNQTLSLWASTFSKSASLDYPESIKPILERVKSKSVIQLPGWVNVDTPVIEDTPTTQMTQTQAPEPVIPGMPSPHKIQHGSFLHKPVSPRPSKSPMKSPQPVGSAKKKVFKLDNFDDGDFVVIKHSPKKKMLLTDHQKEMMKEKRAIPAMYNSLEQSMDNSLMAAHFTTDTQMDGSLSNTPTPTPTSTPFSLFGSVIPPTGGENKSPKEKKSKDTSKKSPKSSDNKSLTVDNEDSSGPRRSGRSRQKKDKDSDPTDNKKDVKIRSSPRNSSKEKDNKLDNEINTVAETEPMDVESDGGINESEPYNKTCDKPIEGSGKKADSGLNTDKSQTDSGASGRSESGVDKTSSGDSVASSAPQNILGAIGFTLSSSKSSSEEDKDKVDTIDLTNTQSQVKGDGTELEQDQSDKASSEPLLSWTQKLNELSQSPQLQGRKWSSQESTKSPQRRTRSPFKSPKRNKKKPTDENEGKGGILDKWIIRSPGKPGFTENINTDIIVANVSQTLVEETQSPTKFNSKEKKEMDTTNSPSIMETPPKNVLEIISVNHSNSSRKLFGSQDSEAITNIVEDSNMVPASPNSKSFTLRTGTPVMKLKRLTHEEILKFSPSRRSAQNENSQNKSNEDQEKTTTTGSAKKVILGSANPPDSHDSESSHAHDDFSVFTPLDSEPKIDETQDDKITNSVDTKSNDKVDELSGSENLFTQENTEKLSQDEDKSKNNSVEPDKKIELSFKPTEDSIAEFSSQDETNLSQDSEASTVSTPRRGRKRKQIDPKKMTPENMKRRKKDGGNTPVRTPGTRSKKSLGGEIENTEEMSENMEQNKKSGNDVSNTETSSTKKRRGRKANKDKKGNDDVASSQDSQSDDKGNDSSDEFVDGGDKKKPRRKVKAKSQEKGEEKKNEVKATNIKKEDEIDGNVCSGAKIGDDSEMNEPTTMEVDIDTKKDVIADIIQGEIEIVGQKTPEGQKNSVKEPERRSTSKHKKAVVQKLIGRRSKDIVNNDSDTNLDAEDAFKQMNNEGKKSENTESKPTETVAGESDNEKLIDKTGSGSSDSDDNIPLIQMHKNLKDKAKDMDDDSKSSEKVKMSPKNTRQSRANTRLRSGKNVKLSPQAKKSINLAIKRSRKASADNKSTEELRDVADESKVNDNDSKSDNKDVSDTIFKVGDENAENVDTKSNEKMDEKLDAMNTEVVKKVTIDTEELDETPRKTLTKSSMASMLMMRNSDSKLVVGSRKFEKRKGVARRSILKPYSSESSEMSVSPQRKFHPIEVARIYSPTASPSASILKRRRLSEDPGSDTNSPPPKQRRVSFASPLDDSCSELPLSSENPCSPLVTKDRITQDTISEKTGGDLTQTTQTPGTTQTQTQTQGSDGGTSQRNYESSQGTQINSSEPVYPELIGCSQGVEKVLPQLTSSIWCRGLGQLVRARNIHTIGDLSALSESDVHSLPIRSPKVVTVKKVLKEYGKNLESTMNKRMNAPRLKLESQLKTEERKAKTETSSQKPEETTDSGDKLNTTDVESMLASSGDLLDEVRRLSQCVDQSGDSLKSCDQEDSQSGSTSGGIQNLNLVENLGKLGENCQDNIKGLSAIELVKVSKQLTNMLTEVNKAIANVVSTRCSSPNR